MNSSLWSANLATHIRIVAVAIVAAAVFVAAGINARTDNPNSVTAVSKADGPALKAGLPPNVTANEVSKIR